MLDLPELVGRLLLQKEHHVIRVEVGRAAMAQPIEVLGDLLRGALVGHLPAVQNDGVVDLREDLGAGLVDGAQHRDLHLRLKFSEGVPF